MGIDIDLNRDDINGFSLDFSRINQYGGMIAYGGPNVIETSFIDKDNSPGGTSAFNNGALGGIFLLKDWDSTLTDAGYNADANTDQKYKDIYVRFRPDLEHENWALFVDYFDSNKDFALKMYRKLQNKLVERQLDGLEYQSAYAFTEEPSASEFKTLPANSLSLSIEDSFTPYFRFGAQYGSDPATGQRATKLKQAQIVITCNFLSEIRNYGTQGGGTFINEFGDVGTAGTMTYNMDESNGFMPFQVVKRDRYKFKHIRGGQAGGVVAEGGTIINNEEIETDEDEILGYADEQYTRINRQEVNASIQFTGTNSGFNIGDKVDNLVIEGNTIPVDAVVLTLNQNIESGGTSITIGKP